MADSGTSQASSRSDTSLNEAEALLKQQRFGDSLQRVQAVLDASPELPAALFLAAVNLRYLRRFDEALGTLSRLVRIAPDYGRAFQEIGHNHRDCGRIAPACEAYARATELNPGLLAAWRFLAELRQRSGDAEGARVAASNFKRLADLPRELVTVTSQLHEGKIYKAEQLCRHFLQKHPHHPEAMRLLAAIGMQLHVYDDAEFLLESVLELEPDFDLARMDYVKVLHQRQKFGEAWEAAAELRRRMPGNLAAELAYANQCSAIGRYDEALAVLEPLIERSPQPWNVQMLRGHALKTIGQHDDAVAAYRAAYRGRPAFGDAWWSLANMKTFRFDDDEIERMRSLIEAGGLTPVDEVHLRFALGKALEDREAWPESFTHYAEGNSIKRAQIDYSAERMGEDFDRQKAFFTPERAAGLLEGGFDAPDPIFIVGLPRAGSTLIEQILASHPAIDGTLELPNILAMAHRLNGRRRRDDEPRYPGVLAEMSAEERATLGRQFIEDTRIHRQDAPLFLDKMPNNFRHIGLIFSILPNARVIDARRSAMGCCFSGFKQLFAEGQEFSYSQADIGRYYRDYVDLMTHWNTVYPGRILQVDYEDVVDDLDSQVRRMLDYLGLDFDPACVEFHRTQRSVRTASSEQVRQPIYRSGIEQWRHYAPWLGELLEALGPELAPPRPVDDADAYNDNDKGG
ncbi:tetratricopeptide repeat protein [Wenzhouxiangella sp. XN79A]|uniref:tetratricopeptide repeat-containing sulfotransferase family protein n=1 Tax=Wenzhouxiangella sp. XN79A TaxID=2724193 RepID=UPI00144AF790|nr:tetratricopeptide repeat-containing sulfotransferase family protein [Wenzhouxiangella sp. XN79A]NKI33990.1 tetratricopeptide repeat protein [Wenzhouxiangella sp. XN79A]